MLSLILISTFESNILFKIRNEKWVCTHVVILGLEHQFYSFFIHFVIFLLFTVIEIRWIFYFAFGLHFTYHITSMETIRSNVLQRFSFKRTRFKTRLETECQTAYIIFVFVSSRYLNKKSIYVCSAHIKDVLHRWECLWPLHAFACVLYTWPGTFSLQRQKYPNVYGGIFCIDKKISKIVSKSIFNDPTRYVYVSLLIGCSPFSVMLVDIVEDYTPHTVHRLVTYKMGCSLNSNMHGNQKRCVYLPIQSIHVANSIWIKSTLILIY